MYIVQAITDTLQISSFNNKVTPIKHNNHRKLGYRQKITDNVDTSVVLQLIALIVDDILWYYNYEPFTPVDPSMFVAVYNGIYEVEFYDPFTTIKYYASTEVTQAQTAYYIKITGDDGNIYGVLGIPQSVSMLTFTTVAQNCPYTYKIYVNGVQVSNAPVLTITNLVADDTIVVVVTDCCGAQLTATTYILPCVAPVLTLATTSTTKHSIEQFIRRILNGKPSI
jgi:hypothetical protein